MSHPGPCTKANYITNLSFIKRDITGHRDKRYNSKMNNKTRVRVVVFHATLKSKTDHTIRTSPKSNMKIAEIEGKWTHPTFI